MDGGGPTDSSGKARAAEALETGVNPHIRSELVTLALAQPDTAKAPALASAVSFQLYALTAFCPCDDECLWRGDRGGA